MFWFSKKTYPEFWFNYTKTFTKEKIPFEDIRFVVFDTETTGLDPKTDSLLSIGAVAVQNKQIQIQDHFESFVLPQSFSKETVHIHGIRKDSKNKIPEEKAIERFLSYLKNSVVVAHHAAFDMAIINESLKRLGLPKLKNTVLDTGNLYLKSDLKLDNKDYYFLDEIAKTFHIPLHDRHNAAGDAFITAQIFVKLLKHLEKKNALSISYLKRPAKRTGLL